MGISHPGVLHHFGSRDGLLQALYHRWSRKMRDRALERLSRAGSGITEALESMVRALIAPRYAQLLAHLLAADVEPFPNVEERGLGQVAELLHTERVRQGMNEDAEPEESKFLLLLGMSAVYGDALVGDALRDRLGLANDSDTTTRYRRWAIRLLAERLHSPRPQGE